MLLGIAAILFMACMLGGAALSGDSKPVHSKAMAKVVEDYKPPC